jgi:hypothetical protein
MWLSNHGRNLENTLRHIQVSLATYIFEDMQIPCTKKTLVRVKPVFRLVTVCLNYLLNTGLSLQNEEIWFFKAQLRTCTVLTVDRFLYPIQHFTLCEAYINSP